MHKKRLLTWLFALTPLLVTLFVLPILPNTIPAHYSFSGEVTRYGSKYEVLILPVIAVAMSLFWLLMDKLLMDKIAAKDKEKSTQNKKVLFWINISVTFLFLAIQIWILHMAYTNAEAINNSDFDSMKIVSVCLSVVWIVLGNLLPKCKQNYFIGFRTAQTLGNEATWYKTHRFGGKLFFIYGVISALLCMFVFDGYPGLIASCVGICIMVIPIIVYSNHIYKQETNSKLKNKH